MITQTISKKLVGAASQLLPKVFIPLLLLAFLVQSCSPKYDLKGVQNAENLAKAIPELMEMATSKKYDEAAAKIVVARNDIESAASHSQSIKKNKEIATMWQVFRDEQSNPFFEQWKTKGKLDKDFVKNYVAQVNASLASILRAEKAKKKK